MGYRIYMSVVTNEDADKLLQLKEIPYDPENEDWEYLDFKETVKILDELEFGKYYELSDIANNYPTVANFHNEDTECYVCDDKILLAAIDDYKAKVLKHMREDVEKYKGDGGGEMAAHELGTRISMLEIAFEDMSRDSGLVTKSWYYEHSIFNLVAIYKKYDWSKYKIVYRGY